MELYIIFILMIVSGLVFYFTRKKNQIIVDLPDNIYKNKKFMSKDKIEFHKRLLRLLPENEYFIFPEVSMGSLLTPNVSKEHVDYYKIKETFANKVIDFVITNNEHQIYFLIEFQEQQGETNKDLRIFKNLQKAGYKVIIWNASNLPSNKEIQLKLTGKVNEIEENNGLI